MDLIACSFILFYGILTALAFSMAIHKGITYINRKRAELKLIKGDKDA